MLKGLSRKKKGMTLWLLYHALCQLLTYNFDQHLSSAIY